MSPVRKGTTALFISKINKPVTPSSSAIHSEGSVFHCGAGVVLHAAEVRFVTGSSQQGTWIKEAWFTEHITGVKPATNYPHQWPMLGDCGFKAAPSAGAKDVYGRKIFKAAGCWKKKKKKKKSQQGIIAIKWEFNCPQTQCFLQDEVSNSKCFFTMYSALKTTAETPVQQCDNGPQRRCPNRHDRWSSNAAWWRWTPAGGQVRLRHLHILFGNLK